MVQQHFGALHFCRGKSFRKSIINRAKHRVCLRIPVLIVTAKEVTADEHAKLSGFMTAILSKSDFDADRFMVEVRRALAGRSAVI